VGMFVPLVGLAVPMLYSLTGRIRRSAWIWPAILTVSLLTNLLVIVSGLAAAANRDPILYLAREEVNGFRWLDKNTAQDAVVLSSTGLVLFIPAWSGRSVVYGHPFESINAEQNKLMVDDFLSGKMDETQQSEFIKDNGIVYYFINPKEAINISPPGGDVVYQNDSIAIFEFHP